MFERSCAVALLVAVCAPAAGQSLAPPDAAPLGLTLAADVLRDLPTNDSPFAVLDTLQPEAISSSFASALNLATPPRVGAFLNSWAQTEFRIGDINVTDPREGGTPLLLPVLSFWGRMTTATGGMGPAENAPGLSVTFDPPRPGPTWVRTASGFFSGSPLVGNGGNSPVPIVDRVHDMQEASALLSGPVTDRVGLVVGAAWQNLSHVPAPFGADTTDRVTSVFAHAIVAATPRDEVRTFGWAQRATTAAFSDTAVHVQSTWERHETASVPWRVFGGLTVQDRTMPQAGVRTVDSVLDGPVADAIDPASGTARRWTLGARVGPPPSRPLPSLGIEVDGSQVHSAPTALARIDEAVAGVPARQWIVHPAAATDDRHLTELSVHGDQHVTAGRLTLDGGLKLDVTAGAANGALRGVHWTTWLPSIVARWRLSETAGLALVGSYRRSAYQPPLDILAIGDPAAPVADVSAWNGTSVGPPLARVGPGTGGSTTLTQIDPALERPTTDETVLALQTSPSAGVHLELAAVAKREEPLFALVDAGLPDSAYSTARVPDPSFLPDSPVGTPQVTVYNRPADGYGQDRYVLTNQTRSATFAGLVFLMRASTGRLVLIGGATVSRAIGPAASVGYLATQNDSEALGNLFVDPNAGTEARGRLFADRSYTLKVGAIYPLPWRVTVGATARYQDGQPFSRLVVVPELTQGATAVRSYVNGGSRFTYTATVDVRVQEALAIGRHELAAVLDVYNLSGFANEVAEDVVSGPAFRTPASRQPPRTAILGVRVGF